MISNKQKGLTNIVAKILFNIIYSHYYQHIADNIT